MKNLLKAYLINGVYYFYIDELNKDSEKEIKLVMVNGFMIIKFTEKELEVADLIDDESKLKEMVMIHNKLLKTLVFDKSTPSYVINSVNNVLITHILGKEI